MERFIGILIENYAGAFPLWLAPEQVVVLNISEHQADYAEEVAATLARGRLPGREPICETRKLPIKYGNIACKSCPYQLVVGDKEKQAKQVAVRTRSGEDLGAMPLEAFIARLAERGRRPPLAVWQLGGATSSAGGTAGFIL